jgi:hypothetical protein
MEGEKKESKTESWRPDANMSLTKPSLENQE